MSPDTGSGFQPGSLPSSISESVDVAIAQSVEDLSLEESDPLIDHQSLLIQGEEVREGEGVRGDRRKGIYARNIHVLHILHVHVLGVLYCMVSDERLL